MALICHIARRADWTKAKDEGRYAADTLHSHGFIHCSSPEQLISVANCLFKGDSDLVLLGIDESLVQSEIRYENLEGGAKLFPHIYGSLNLDAIVQVMEFPPTEDDTFELPVEIGSIETRLKKQDQRALALWACDCAEHVLPCFETRYPSDKRPREAIEAARAWTQGRMGVAEVRTAAFAAHAAARDAVDAAACAAARSAGHAAATAHVADHARHAAAYAVKAVTHAARPVDASETASRERSWQVQCLPEHLRLVSFLGNCFDSCPRCQREAGSHKKER